MPHNGYTIVRFLDFYVQSHIVSKFMKFKLELVKKRLTKNSELKETTSRRCMYVEYLIMKIWKNFKLFLNI